MRTLIQVFTRRNHAATPEHNLQIIPIAHSRPSQAMVICGPGNLHRKIYMMQNLIAHGRIKGSLFTSRWARNMELGMKRLNANHVGLLAVGHGFTEVCPLVRDRIGDCQRMGEAISDGALRAFNRFHGKKMV